MQLQSSHSGHEGISLGARKHIVLLGFAKDCAIVYVECPNRIAGSNRLLEASESRILFEANVLPL